MAMHMRIDTKEKIKYIRAYLQQLRSSSETQPFITINPNECGFYDYQFITRRRLTLTEIEKNLKDNKYETVKQICEDLKHLYLNISDYLLLGDPLQDECTRLIKALGDFEAKFSDDFKENRLLRAEFKASKKEEPKAAAKDKEDLNKENMKQKEKATEMVAEYNRKSTFAQKLEMFFYLRSHEDNVEYIKSIGDGYGIGSQDPNGDYIIRLDTSANTCPWLELLQKKDQ